MTTCITVKKKKRERTFISQGKNLHNFSKEIETITIVLEWLMI